MYISMYWFTHHQQQQKVLLEVVLLEIMSSVILFRSQNIIINVNNVHTLSIIGIPISNLKLPPCMYLLQGFREDIQYQSLFC